MVERLRRATNAHDLDANRAAKVWYSLFPNPAVA